ncbi:MAG: acylglycerol kinase family protein, partial [Ignavibacteria bacterium]
MKAAIIMNMSAGSSTDENKKLIKDEFQKLNVECDFLNFDPEKMAELIKEIDGRGFDVIIPAGGDGTVSAVATELAETDKVMSVLPMGTLNHFAKDIG